MAQIEVTRHYNNVDGAQIKPGIYDVSNPIVAPYIERLIELEIAQIVRVSQALPAQSATIEAQPDSESEPTIEPIIRKRK